MSTYDEVPYTSYPYARTHPDRLCTVARLFGMQPSPITGCRVLELGCAAGGNLVPMAELLPASEFVGIDGSARQIAEGRELVAAAGIGNVRLEHGDILDVAPSWGRFDYIICHGVYSWVDAAVQDKILDIMRELLQPHGVGYISYNVYPGWHMREAIRHMMRYHVRSLSASSDRTAQAKALVDFLAAHVPAADGPYALLLQRELQLLQKTSADYLFHEHLEDVNQPVYFHEFAERLHRHQLKYLGEADVHTMLLKQYAPEASAALEHVAPDIVSMEQYMDFVRNRQFRSTLVCHADVDLERSLVPEVVDRFSVAFAPGVEAKPIDLSPGLVQEFSTADNMVVSSERPLTKAALVVLRARWPASIPFALLCDEAFALLREAGIVEPSSSRSDLAADLLECHVSGAGISFRTWCPPIALHPGRHPCTTKVARVQIARGRHVASLLHETNHLDRGPARILGLLDGRRGEDDIVEELATLVEAGELDLSRDDEPIRSREQMREPLASVLRETLQWFARRGLLVDSDLQRGAV